MTAAMIAGIDIGGSKTQIAVACRGKMVAERVLDSAEWRVRDIETDAHSLATLLRQMHDELPVAVAVGSHGCDNQSECEAFQRVLEHAIGIPVHVVNDAELMVPAAGFMQGIGLVAGTGSIAVSRLKDDTMLVAGGWGWILGDEGSAPSLVREASRAVRASIDSEGPPDKLTDALLETLGGSDPTQLGGLLQRAGSAAAVGRHAHAVFAAAQAGSQLAARVIETAGGSLADLVRRLVLRGAPAERVVAGGGVISSQPLLMAALTEAMQNVLPGTEVILLRTPPVAGAAH
jgi:N-acetylglucosamine kinase-like BadF-type ATPase